MALPTLSRPAMPWKPPLHRPARPRARPPRETGAYRRLLWTERYRRFRRWLLVHRPVCQDCQAVPSKDVHHQRRLSDRPEDLCDPDQCLALCHACHSRRTRRGE